MPRLALTLVACFWSGTALADSAALLIENAEPSMFDRLRGEGGVSAAVAPLRAEDVDVLALRGADGAEMRDGLLRFLDTLDEDTERVAVLLSGRFVHTGTESYLLPFDTDPREAGAVFAEAMPLSPLLALLSAYPGRAVLMLAEGSPQSLRAAFLSDGAGEIDLPQGVTLIRGAPDVIAELARSDLATPARTLVASARAEGLAVEGYAPEDFTFLPAPAVRSTTAPAPVVDAEAEARLWREAAETDTREAYALYLSAFPEGPNANRARDRIAAIAADPNRAARQAEDELALSRDARAEIQRDLSLLDYNTRGIDGIFGPGTRGAIESWQRDTGFDPTGFLTGNQISRLDAQAARRAEELEAEAEARERERAAADRAYWRDTGAAGDAVGLRAYLDRYPDGDYAEIAQERLDDIEAEARAAAAAQDRRAWEEAQATGTTAAYEEYLRAYPEGAFAGEAQRRLIEVQRPSEDRQAIAQAQAQEAALNLTPTARRLAEAKLDALDLKPGRVDGEFDKDTRRAIRRYQRSRGLDVSGYLDQATVVRLLADSIRR